MDVRRPSDLVSIDVRAWAASPGAGSEATHVSAPAEVACFSRGEDRAVVFGSRAQLQHFKDPRMESRLDAGLNQFVRKQEEDGVGVELVVSCLLAAGFDVGSKADIVTYRNNLNKVRFCCGGQQTLCLRLFCVSCAGSDLVSSLSLCMHADWRLPVQYSRPV